MITEAVPLSAVGDIRGDDIEDYKVWLAARPRAGGGMISAETHRPVAAVMLEVVQERADSWGIPGRRSPLRTASPVCFGRSGTAGPGPCAARSSPRRGRVPVPARRHTAPAPHPPGPAGAAVEPAPRRPLAILRDRGFPSPDRQHGAGTPAGGAGIQIPPLATSAAKEHMSGELGSSGAVHRPKLGRFSITTRHYAVRTILGPQDYVASANHQKGWRS